MHYVVIHMSTSGSSPAHQWAATDLLTDKNLGADVSLAPALLDAYCRTDYRILLSEPVIMRIGQRSAALDGLLTTQDAKYGLFISAWNPRSRPLSVLYNAARHAGLIHGMKQRNLRWLPAMGADETGEWPAEESVFILDATVLLADRLMTEWDQNAAVWVEHGKAPALVLHPRFRGGALLREF